MARIRAYALICIYIVAESKEKFTLHNLTAGWVSCWSVKCGFVITLSRDHVKFCKRTLALLQFWELDSLLLFRLRRLIFRSFRSEEMQKSARKLSHGLNFSTLESGINVSTWINVTPETFGKNNKRRHP